MCAIWLRLNSESAVGHEEVEEDRGWGKGRGITAAKSTERRVV